MAHTLCGARRVTPDDIATINRLRSEGWSQVRISRELGMPRSTVRYYFLKAQRADNLYPLDNVTLPLVTDHGLMWFMPIRPPQTGDRSEDCCAKCPLEQQCREHVARGDFIACERPLRSEVRE